MRTFQSLKAPSIAVILCSLFATLTPTFAYANGAFSVSPTRLDVSAKRTTTELRLTNTSDKPVTVKVFVKSWTQENGVNKTVKTRDIAFTPPIAKIPGYGATTVRLKYRKGITNKVEKSYRVYAEQLPSAVEAENSVTTSDIRVRFSVPLFVKPVSKLIADFAYSTKINPDGTVRLDLKNKGNFHIKASNLAIFPQDIARKELMGKHAIARGRGSLNDTSYLLPGSTQSWLIKPLPEKERVKNGDQLLVATDYSGRPLGRILSNTGHLWLKVR